MELMIPILVFTVVFLGSALKVLREYERGVVFQPKVLMENQQD